MILTLLSLAAVLGVCTPVEGDRILMQDLAAAQPVFAGLDPQEAVGYAPAPGAHRIFGKAELERLARAHNLSLDAGAGLCFERAMETLPRERVLAALASSLPAGDLRLELLDFSHWRVPRGELEFPRQGLGAATGLTALWRGRVKYAAGRSVPVWAKVRLSVRGARVVAVSALPAGKPIRAEQLRWESCERFPFAPGPAEGFEQVVGKMPRRPIRPGQPVFRNLLAAPRDIQSGDTVAVEVASGGAQLKFEAHAESGGHTGEFILVRNPASGKRFRARVQGPGRAVVDADPGGQEDDDKAVVAGTSHSSAGGERRQGESSQNLAPR